MRLQKKQLLLSILASLLICALFFLALFLKTAPPPLSPLPYTHDQLLTTYEINSYVLSHLPTDPAAARAYIKESSSIDFHDPIVEDIAQEILAQYSPTTDLEKLQAINRYLQSHFSYCLAVQNSIRTASDALRQEINVCHGYALAMIALCNAMDIPAAYVSALSFPAPTDLTLRQVFTAELSALEEDDTVLHATVVAFVDGKWVEADPTNNLVAFSTHVFAKFNLYIFIAPPGQLHRVTSDPIFTELSQSSTQISIDGQSVTEFPAFTDGTSTYLPARALAGALETYGITPEKRFDITLTNVYRYDIGIKRYSNGMVYRWHNSVIPAITPGVYYHRDTVSSISDYHTAQFYGRDINVPINIGGVYCNLHTYQGLIDIQDSNDPSSVYEYFIEIHSLLRALDISVTYDATSDTYLLDTTRPYISTG